MIKDLIAITLLTWLIESLGKVIGGTFNLIGKGFGGVGKGIVGLFKNATAEEGIVTKTIDGDSIVVKTPEGEKEVRIRGIDAPEYGQDGFLEAKRKVRELTIGQKVALLNAETDKYGRIASDVELIQTEKNVAEELAKSGVAYPDPRGSSSGIKKLSKEAKSKSLGVWKKPQQTPWEFRDMM
jgi:endonuclease YncB( thermonuclease family)